MRCQFKIFSFKRDLKARKQIILQQNKLKIMQFLLAGLGMTACTGQSPPLPPLDKYIKDTELMLNIANKFQNEPDIKTLHKVAVATQSTRVVSCENYFGECTSYGKFISLIIEVSADHKITPEERTLVKKAYNELNSTILEARKATQHPILHPNVSEIRGQGKTPPLKIRDNQIWSRISPSQFETAPSKAGAFKKNYTF